jgi:hypothetical protein
MDLQNVLTQTFNGTFGTFSGSPKGNTTWQTTLPHGLRNIPGNGEEEYYSDPTVGVDPFSVQDGILSITATAGSNPAGLPYNSGVITTEKSFSQLYGYFDIRAELPTGEGMWPAFWLLPSNLQGTAEIDVMEELGSNPWQYSATVHSPDNGIDGTAVPTTDLSQAFHDYGVYWTPTTISFYFDGKEVAVAPTPADLNTPMFMLVDLAISSEVSTSTTFPASLQVQSVDAYAYNPAVPGPPAPLLVELPAIANGEEGAATQLSGVIISDSNAAGAGTISVTVSDKSLGILWVEPTNGVVVSTEDTWDVQLTGSLAAVNAALATLAYKNEPTQGAAPTSDTITVAASDAAGDMDSERIALTLGTAPAPTFISMGSTPERVEAHTNDVFVFTNGSIADPHLDGGLADHIINFQTEAAASSGSDFLAFHGFDPTAQLVFDHDAAPNGVDDPSMQYYRVESATGGSPLILIQMANGASGHLTSADYGFYPT